MTQINLYIALVCTLGLDSILRIQTIHLGEAMLITEIKLFHANYLSFRIIQIFTTTTMNNLYEYLKGYFF